MPKGSIDKITRNYRYSRLRKLGVTRPEAIEGRDYTDTRFHTLVAMLSTGHTFAQAKSSYNV